MPGCQIIYEGQQAGSLQVDFGFNVECGEVQMRKDEEPCYIFPSKERETWEDFLKLADAADNPDRSMADRADQPPIN